MKKKINPHSKLLRIKMVTIGHLGHLRYLLLGLLVLRVFSSPVVAINMDSSQFKIQFGNVNIGAKDQSSTSYNLGVSLGQEAAGKFASTGYVIKAGFQYIHSIIPFTFSISNTHIDFGTVLIGSFYTGSTNLKVSFGAAGDYQVTALADNTLRTLGGDSLPFTVCDSGPCTPTSAQPWTTGGGVSGFGYNMNCSGITDASTRCTPDIPADFVGSTYYRPFANKATAGTPATVMSNVDVTSEEPEDASISNTHETQMTMKIYVVGTQPGGSYSTVINFVATPSY